MASALILAAGKATRLAGLRDLYAKANVPVGPTTPLRFLLDAFGTRFSDIWINLHFKGDQVRGQAEDYVANGVRLHFLQEPELLGTGGTLLAMMAQSRTLPDAIVNAKMFTDYPFHNLCCATPGTLVLHPPSDLHAFGGLTYDAACCIQGLLAKDESHPPKVSAAVFTGICKPSLTWVAELEIARQKDPQGVLCLIRHGLLPALKKAPGHAIAQLHTGRWCEISTPQRVVEAAEQLSRGLTP